MFFKNYKKSQLFFEMFEAKLAALNSTNNAEISTQNNSDTQGVTRRREVQSFESEHMPPPIYQSSINQQRTCEVEPLTRVQNTRPNDTDDSSLIPNSQSSTVSGAVSISEENVVKGKRNRRQQFK